MKGFSEFKGYQMRAVFDEASQQFLNVRLCNPAISNFIGIAEPAHTELRADKGKFSDHCHSDVEGAVNRNQKLGINTPKIGTRTDAIAEAKLYV